MLRMVSPLPEPRCPKVMGILYISGPRAVTVDCKRWRCKKCSRKHFLQQVYHLADVTQNNEYLYQITVKPEQVETVKRAIRRAKSSAWCIRFVDYSVRAITERPIKGRGWKTQELTRIDLVADLMENLDSTLIRRARDFTRNWKTDPPAELAREKSLFRWVDDSLSDVEKTFTRYGQSVYNDGWFGDPLEIAERMKRDIASEDWENPDEFVTNDV